MKAVHRQRMEPQYKWLYSGTKCYYCGDKGDSIDHVPSLLSAYTLGTEFFRRNHIPLYKVRACRHCNDVLGSKEIYCLTERANYLYDRLIKRFQPILESEEWTDKELSELGPNLHHYITNSETVREWLTRRLEYMEEMHDPVGYWKVRDPVTGEVIKPSSSQEVEW